MKRIKKKDLDDEYEEVDFETFWYSLKHFGNVNEDFKVLTQRIVGKKGAEDKWKEGYYISWDLILSIALSGKRTKLTKKMNELKKKREDENEGV